MKHFVNYIYSLIIRSSWSDNDSYRIGWPLVFFGFGSITNLFIYPFLRHPGVLMISFVISPVIWLLWKLLIGFDPVESVKKFDRIEATALLILILIGLIGIFLLPVGIDYLINS